jgi:small subunit ribosomal protein S6
MTVKFSGRMMVAKKVSGKASVVEDKQLRDYEMVLIINPEIADEALDTTIDNVSRFITGKGGIVSSAERWGRRKLAYPIGHFVEGNYVLTQLKLTSALTKELEANLKMSEETLRHLLIRLGS